MSFLSITVLATAKVILDNVVTVTAFTNPDEKGNPQYPVSASAELITLNVLWILETIIADAFIIYRLWVVWQKKWVLTILPSVLLVGCFAAGVYNLYVRPLQATLAPAEYQRRSAASRNAFISLTLAINLGCTGLIAFRIWNVRRRVASSTGGGTSRAEENDPVKRVTNIIVESALIYTIHLILIIICTAANSPLTAFFVPIGSPTIALVFGSIIVRSVAGGGTGQTTHAGELSGNQGTAYLRSTRVAGRDDTSSQIGSGGLQVKLERVITSKVDGVDSLEGSDKYRPDDV